MYSSFTLVNPSKGRKPVRYFYSNSTAMAGACIGVFCLNLIVPGINEALAIPSPKITTEGSSFTLLHALLQAATFWLVHRDLVHLCSCVSLLLLLGPRVERLMSDYKFFYIVFVSQIVGGLSSLSIIGTGMTGTAGLVLAFALLVLRYSLIEGLKTQTRRSLHKFPSELDVNLILVSFLSLSYLFAATPKTEADSEYGHVVTSLIAFLLIQYRFGSQKKKRQSLKLPALRRTSRHSESQGFLDSIRNIYRRGDSSESESEPETRTARLVNKIPGLRKRNKVQAKRKEDSSSDEEDSDREKKKSHGVWSNIPKDKRKKYEKFHESESESDEE